MFAGYFVIELRRLSRRFGQADCLDVGLGQILDGNCPAVAAFLAGRGDALHLAIATNRSAEALYSLDRKLIEAGRRLGVPAVGLSQPPDGR